MQAHLPPTPTHPPALLRQVLDEIGVDLGAALPAAKQQRVPGQKQAAAAPAAAEDDEADELASRLAALK